MKLVDVHAHLTDEIYSEDLQDVLDKIDKEMLACICSGYDEKSSKNAVKIAQNNKKIYATVGIHPENIDFFYEKDSENIDMQKLLELKEIANENKVVGIGEIGLDYHFFSGKSEEEIKKIKFQQKEAFIIQIELANKLNLPVVVHCRDALSDCIEILREHKLDKPSLMHCYADDIENAQKLIDLNFSFSFGGITTFKNAKNIQEVAKNLPLQNMLLETDCPYLCPDPFRGKRNEPVFVKYVADKIATLRGISIEEVANQTSLNASRIFGL